MSAAASSSSSAQPATSALTLPAHPPIPAHSPKGAMGPRTVALVKESSTPTKDSCCEAFKKALSVTVVALGVICIILCIVGLSMSGAGYSLKAVPLIGDALAGKFGCLIMAATAVGAMALTSLCAYALANAARNKEAKKQKDEQDKTFEARVKAEVATKTASLLQENASLSQKKAELEIQLTDATGASAIAQERTIQAKREVAEVEAGMLSLIDENGEEVTYTAQEAYEHLVYKTVDSENNETFFDCDAVTKIIAAKDAVIADKDAVIATLRNQLFTQLGGGRESNEDTPSPVVPAPASPPAGEVVTAAAAAPEEPERKDAGKSSK